MLFFVLMLKKQRKYNEEETLFRVRAWCDYQERSQQQVRDKLYSWGLHRDEVERLIAELISDNYLNEERFARAYVSGKFRIKKWGRRKILEGLKPHRLSAYCVRAGMQEISEDEYFETAQSLVTRKASLIMGTDQYKLRIRLYNYLMQKGYEREVIMGAIDRYFKSAE